MRQRYREPKIKRQGKYYVIRITNTDGRRGIIRLGTTLEEARVNFRDYMLQLLNKKSDYPSYRISLQQGIETYLEAKRKQLSSPNSYKRYNEIISNFNRVMQLKFPLINYMDQIKEQHISDFIAYRVDKEHIAHRTANCERDTVSNLFKYLIEEKNFLSHNPVKRIRPLAEPEPDEFFYSKEQTLLILETAKKYSKKIRWDVIFATFFYTGMRRNELRFLTWDDIDFTKGKIFIRPKQITPTLFFNPKTKEKREIPVHPELLPLLKSLSHKSQKWVFVNSKGNYFAPDTIRTKLREICKSVKLPVKSQHKTRHSWASQSTEDGVPLDVIQSIGGWRDAQTMNRYKHLTDSYKTKVFLDRFSLKKDKEKDNGK